VRSADGLVFVYPTTLSTVTPGIKGWIERTLVPGVAFTIGDQVDDVDVMAAGLESVLRRSGDISNELVSDRIDHEENTHGNSSTTSCNRATPMCRDDRNSRPGRGTRPGAANSSQPRVHEAVVDVIVRVRSIRR